MRAHKRYIGYPPQMDDHPALSHSEMHRLIEERVRRHSQPPDPLPLLPWVMCMDWENLLFISWPVPVKHIRPYVPPQLEIDTHDGQAWLTVVTMHMVNLRYRGLPPLQPTAVFPEVNLRTYVRLGNTLGVFFLSIDTGSLLSSWIPRHLMRMPAYESRMRFTRQRDRFFMESHRPASNRTRAASLVVSYTPVGSPQPVRPGTLDDFLTGRYTSFSVTPRGLVLRGDIHRLPVELYNADVKIRENTVARALGLSVPDAPPTVHYVAWTHCLAWPVVPVAVLPDQIAPRFRR